MKCKICGRNFIAKKENRYEITESLGTFESLSRAAKTYECFDCTKCGCQNIAGIREKKPALGKNEVIEFASATIERLSLWSESELAGSGRTTEKYNTIREAMSTVQDMVTEYMEGKC